MFWHGSARQCTVLLPHVCHLLDGRAVVLASSSQTVAAVFSRKWTDRDFEFGRVVDEGKSWLVLTEKRKGAFSEIFEGQEAFLHGVDHRRFNQDKRLGTCHHEFVSYAVEPVIKNLHFEDVGGWLRKRDFHFKIAFYPD